MLLNWQRREHQRRNNQDGEMMLIGPPDPQARVEPRPPMARPGAQLFWH